MSEKYKIFVGRPSDDEVSVGFLEKGNSIVKGKEVKAKLRPGKQVFPATTKSWGRRLLVNKETGKPEWPGKRIDINEPANSTHQAYLGHIEWLDFGHKDGYAIEVRYTKSTSTLDYRYQVAKEGLPTVEQDLENNYIELPSGLNEFDENNDAVFIQFLKIYHGNEDSGSKMETSELTAYREVKTFDSKAQQVKDIDEQFEAVTIVKEASTFEKLTVLQNIIASVTDIRYDESKEGNLYEAIILFAKQRPGDFLAAISNYKRNISQLIEYTKAYKAFDLTLNGTIVVLQPKKEVLLSDVDAKGDAMADWLFENCMEPEVFTALEKLKVYSLKFK